MRQRLGVSALLVVIAASGCVLPVGKVYRTVPDPRQDEPVEITAAQGRTLTLADDRTVRIAGVDLSGLTPPQRDTLDANLRPWVGRLVLVTPQSGDLAVVETLVPPPRIWREAPVVILIPIYVDLAPRRTQLAAMIVGAGWAKAKPEEISDPDRADEVARAARQAQLNHWGIWERPEDRYRREYLDPIERGDLQAVRTYLRGHASPEILAEGLRTAVHVNQADVAALLLAAGSQPNAPGPDGLPPLFVAAQNGSTACVRLLLKHGAAPDTGRADGFSPLHIAAAVGHADVVEALLDAGAAVDGQDDRGNRPLFVAASVDQAGPMHVLLRYGAAVNARNEHHRTALHAAAASAGPHTIRVLLEVGTDVSARDAYGHTPLHYAAQRRDQGLARLLRRQGARE